MRLRIAVLIASLVSCAFGQNYTISTFAGSAPGVNLSGVTASLGGGLVSVIADRTNNLFFVSQDSVLRLDASTGILTLVAGNGTRGFSGDNGPAISAQLNNPTGVTVDSAGTLYIADFNNSRVRKVSNGVITTVAGNGTLGFSGDNGLATSAQLYQPQGVAVDSAGNLYIADTYNERVRKVSNGVITTVAGSGTRGFSGDNGPAASAQLYQPQALTVDSAGNLYIADTYNERVRKVSNGVITTVAGNGTFGFSGDNGPATSAGLSLPSGVAVDSAGNLYVADTDNDRIRKVSNGVITTVAGDGASGFSGDNGPATSAQLNGPVGVATDSAGNFYIADTNNSFIRKVSAGVITTVAGDGASGFSGDKGLAASAQLNTPQGLAVDSAGNVYIADINNERVRKVSSAVITTVAGNGTFGFSGDKGPAISAWLDSPRGVAVDSVGNLYIADYGNNRIRKISNSVITTVAGNGTSGFSGDNGPAASAQLSGPVGVAVDSAGNLYIADTQNSCIRKISNGIISTVAGNGTAGFSGDNGPATSAQLNFPYGLAVDAAGNLYIADTDNYRIRKVSAGMITTVVGNGAYGFSGDNGPATGAKLSSPFDVAVDASGSLYIADYYNNVVRKVSNGVITSVAGNGAQGLSGDGGPSTGAQLNYPAGVAVDTTGRVYIADSYNNRIRLLTAPGAASAAGASVITSVSAASGGSNIAQNTFIVIKGSNLVPASTPAAGVIWSTAPSFASGEMPTQLSAVSATVNGKPAYIYFYCSAATSTVCTSDQINVLSPLDSTVGSVPVVVTSTTSLGTTMSSPYSANLATISPTFLLFGSSSYVAATHLDYSLVGPASLYPGASAPANPGEQVVIYAVGFGLPSAPLVAGSSTQSGSLPALPICTIGTNTATVSFAGLISPGLYQLNIIIPTGTPSGDRPITCTYNGAPTPTGDLITVN